MSLIVHIGPGKTGTSAIQCFLSANREKVLQAGIWYPPGPGDDRAIKGGVTSGNASDLARALRTSKPTQQILASLAAGHESILLSSELFWGVPKRQLFNWLEPLDATVIFYVRGQINLFISSYHQRVVSKNMERNPQEHFRIKRDHFKFGQRLQMLKRVSRNVIVRKYNKGVLEDFVTTIGLDPAGFSYPTSNVNERSKSVEFDASFKRMLFEHYREDNELLDSQVGPFRLNADNEAAL